MSFHDRVRRLQPRHHPVVDMKWVMRHRGNHRAFLSRYRRLARQVIKGKVALDEVAPHLFDLASDERMLRNAWDHLARKGGQGAGSDGYRFKDFDEKGVWEECRGLRDEIRSGEYTPAPDHLFPISKGPGRGQRILAIPSIFDRVVGRAVVEVAQRLLDPQFDNGSFGFRPGRSRTQALATAEVLFSQQQRGVWVIEDVQDAFGNVPLPRLLQLVEHYLRSDKLVALIERLVSGAKTPGLRQGSPLSPLLLNLYLHHFLDRPWRKRFPEVPLIRWADDILLLCRNRRQGKEAQRVLVELLQPAAMPLKAGVEKSIRDLTRGNAARWLGFQITPKNGSLAAAMDEEAWDRLGENLALAHSEPDSPLRARAVIGGWIGQMGPCYPSIDPDEACARIKAIAHKQAFEEIQRPERLKALFQKAHARWCWTLQSVRKSFAKRGAIRPR